MNNYELKSQVIHFCNLKSPEERYSELNNSVYMERKVIDIIKELASEATNGTYRQNYIDHMELIEEYQRKGSVALNFFTSIIEIEAAYIKFAFGFDSFPKRKQYLLSAPFLIEKRSIEIITDYIEREKYLSNNVGSRLYRNLLKACRVIGIEEAFTEFATPEKKYVDIMNILFKKDTIPEHLLFLSDYKDEVSSKQFRTVFHYLQAQYEKDKSKRNRIIALWDLISPYQEDKREIWFWE